MEFNKSHYVYLHQALMLVDTYNQIIQKDLLKGEVRQALKYELTRSIVSIIHFLNSDLSFDSHYRYCSDFYKLSGKAFLYIRFKDSTKDLKITRKALQLFS